MGMEGGTHFGDEGERGRGAAGAADNVDNAACIMLGKNSDEEHMLLLSSWRMVVVELSKLPQE